MDFTVALLQRLEEEEGSDHQSLAQLVEAAYKVSLKPWHGWIASAASKVRKHSVFLASFLRQRPTRMTRKIVTILPRQIAMKLIPERKIFISWIVGKDPSHSVMKDEIERLVPLLQPFLLDIHDMLVSRTFCISIPDQFSECCCSLKFFVGEFIQ
jgi:hypothetical protein